MKRAFPSALLIFCFSFFFPGCSLKYGVTYQDETNVPEFIFTDASFTRYEDRKKTMSLQAGRLEQYSDGKTMYAKDVNFTIMDNDGEITTEGACALLSSDTKAENYVLYDNIEINNKKDDLIVSADTLRWNGKTEQLTSSRNDMVTLKKGKTVMHGSGFSASGVSKKFAFNGVVTGQFDQDEKNTAKTESNITNAEQNADGAQIEEKQ